MCDGRVTRAAGIAQDITEQKRIEEERQAFVDAAAHDLKTPLTSLRGQAQLLLRRMRRESLLQADALRPGLVEIDAAAGKGLAGEDGEDDKTAHGQNDIGGHQRQGEKHI